MRRYLLDSDILSYLEQKDSPFSSSVRDRLSRLDDDDEVIVSILSLYEISYGISGGPEGDRDFLMQSITSIEEKFLIANLSRKGAEVFGELKSIYRKRTTLPRKTSSATTSTFSSPVPPLPKTLSWSATIKSFSLSRISSHP